MRAVLAQYAVLQVHVRVMHRTVPIRLGNGSYLPASALLLRRAATAGGCCMGASRSGPSMFDRLGRLARRRARAHALYSAHNVEHGLRASSALASNRRWQRRWPPPKPALALRRTRVELPLRPKAGPMRFGLGHVLSIWLGRRPFLRERCCFRAEQLRAALRDLVRGLFGLAQCSLAPSTCTQRSWLCRVRPV